MHDDEAAPPDMTQEQIRRLLLDMREGSEVGQMIARRRPQRGTLGRQLDLWLDLLAADLLQNTAQAALPAAEAQQRRRQEEPPPPGPDDDVRANAWRVALGTPAAEDLAAWTAAGWPEDLLQPYREQDSGPALRFAHRIMTAAVDQLRGVAVLIGDVRLDRPPLALSRVVLDAAAHLNHVLAPGLEPEQRLLRVLNETLARAGEDYRSAAREKDPERIGEAAGEITAIFRAVGSRAPTRWNRERLSLPYIGDKPPYTSKMIDDLLGSTSAWSSLSGVVHNKEDDGWRMMLGLTLGIDNPHKDQFIALQALGAVLGFVALTEQIEEYTGWDLSATRASNDPLIGLWASGAGLNDDTYREEAVRQRREDGSTERLAREVARQFEHVDAKRAERGPSV